LNVVEVSGLGKRFGGRWIFRNLNFRLEQGDTLVVLGRNGAGKSTLLKTMAGLISPSEGTVTLPEGDVRLSVALSALEQALYPNLTVEEHLRFAGDMRGCPHRTDELLEQVGLVYARRYMAGEMSTGMKARLKLALATQARPKLLLLDEPGAGLDEQGRSLVEALSREQAKRGCLVLATNDPAERRFANVELELAD